MSVSLTAQLREERGKRPVRRLRRSGMIPGVIYGPGQEPIPVKLKRNEVEKVFHHISETVPIELELEDGRKLRVFLKSVQRSKTTDEIVHIDFYVPMKGHLMHTRVPIKYTGKPIGVERGGMLEILVEELPVEVDPDKIVDHIEVDISELGLGESLHVRDLDLPEGMEPMIDEDETLVTIIVPKGLTVEEEEVEEQAEEEVEPEVIKKGKKEEEEES